MRTRFSTAEDRELVPLIASRMGPLGSRDAISLLTRKQFLDMELFSQIRCRAVVTRRVPWHFTLREVPP